MDIAKIKLGKFVNYKTTRATTGRGKVTDIKTSNNGAWITIYDKSADKVLRLRPGNLSA